MEAMSDHPVLLGGLQDALHLIPVLGGKYLELLGVGLHLRNHHR
jgi:hypothetical protein